MLQKVIVNGYHDVSKFLLHALAVVKIQIIKGPTIVFLGKNKMKLENYQITGAKFLENNYHALLGDDMGLGKTAQAIRACDFVTSNITLVICPASVKYHWENEFKKWSLITRKVEVVENGKHKFSNTSNVIIVNYDLILRIRIFEYLNKFNWDVVICDEAHYLKTLTSRRSKLILGRFGLIKNAKYKWMLTGTPIENRPIDLFPMLYVLGRKYLDK